MRSARRSLILASSLLALSCMLPASAKDQAAHRFAVIGHSQAPDGEARIKSALADSSEKSLAFVVLNGIKSEQESCGDRLYQKRYELIEHARRPLIVSLAGSDWTLCRNTANRSSAIERLNRLRELFFSEPNSLGAHKIGVTRLSASPRFRSYAENAHWKVGKVLYATINLPAANNHYLKEAGRNSEYEDRIVANRFWLNRLFAIARSDKVEALVLFSEGAVQPLLRQEKRGLRGLLRREPVSHDGFEATRQQIQTRAASFDGKVLLIDSGALTASPAIEWQGKLGHLSVASQAVEIDVTPSQDAMFSVRDPKQGSSARH